MEFVEHPPHYNQGNVECIDAMLSAFDSESVATFCKLNAFKYIWRSAEHEDGEHVNLRKAIWFLRMAVGEDARNDRKLFSTVGDTNGSVISSRESTRAGEAYEAGEGEEGQS